MLKLHRLSIRTIPFPNYIRNFLCMAFILGALGFSITLSSDAANRCSERRDAEAASQYDRATNWYFQSRLAPVISTLARLGQDPRLRTMQQGIERPENLKWSTSGKAHYPIDKIAIAMFNENWEPIVGWEPTFPLSDDPFFWDLMEFHGRTGQLVNITTLQNSALYGGSGALVISYGLFAPSGRVQGMVLGTLPLASLVAVFSQRNAGLYGVVRLLQADGTPILNFQYGDGGGCSSELPVVPQLTNCKIFSYSFKGLPLALQIQQPRASLLSHVTTMLQLLFSFDQNHVCQNPL